MVKAMTRQPHQPIMRCHQATQQHLFITTSVSIPSKNSKRKQDAQSRSYVMEALFRNCLLRMLHRKNRDSINRSSQLCKANLGLFAWERQIEKPEVYTRNSWLFVLRANGTRTRLTCYEYKYHFIEYDGKPNGAFEDLALWRTH